MMKRENAMKTALGTLASVFICALFACAMALAFAPAAYANINLNVWEGNDNARKFYETMGLKPMKTTMEYIL